MYYQIESLHEAVNNISQVASKLGIDSLPLPVLPDS